MNEAIYWIWLSLSVTAGSSTFGKLIQKYPSGEDIYYLEDNDYFRLLGSRCRDIKKLCNKSLDKAREVYDFCTAKGVGMLIYNDKNFPEKLKSISNPPVVLYYRGKLPDFNSECYISVVGTRRLTDYGRRFSYSISHDLARAGAVIVSGMAIGIDGVAHAGAIAAGGKTVAVIGSGIDVCYPDVHKRLAREIVKCGCVLTEYAPHTKPMKKNFPKRNRIISGLSCATLVIEGKDDSGALITAERAKEQGRAVYALPGNVDNKTSAVSNLLILNGARLARSAEDIIDDFEFVYPGKLNRFALIESVDMKMKETLRELEISCVAQSDSIFSPRTKKRDNKLSLVAEAKPSGASCEPQEPKVAELKEPDTSGFDRKMLDVYKRIPSSGDCSVEDLCSEEYKLKDVLRILMKLEMAKCVVMLPSERVKRNLR